MLEERRTVSSSLAQVLLLEDDGLGGEAGVCRVGVLWSGLAHF